MAAVVLTMYEWDELVGLVVEPNRMACLFIDQDAEDPVRYSLAHRSGMSDDMLGLCGEWAAQRVSRFLEHGPEPDGWHRRRTDGVWQLWAALVGLPSLD